MADLKIGHEAHLSPGERRKYIKLSFQLEKVGQEVSESFMSVQSKLNCIKSCHKPATVRHAIHYQEETSVVIWRDGVEKTSLWCNTVDRGKKLVHRSSCTSACQSSGAS